MDGAKQRVLCKYNPIPENASFLQRSRYFFLCPPHNGLGTILSAFLLFFMLWLTAYSIVRNDALPGGNIFALFILVGAGFIGGELMSLIKLPPLLGMLLVGFMFRNVPGMKIAGDISPTWSRLLRNVALTVILTRAGMFVYVGLCTQPD